MGIATSKKLLHSNSGVDEEIPNATGARREKGMTEMRRNNELPSIPPNCTRVSDEDQDFIMDALRKLLLFKDMYEATQKKIVKEMYLKEVKAGEIVIKQGDSGIAACELYVVKSGKFEVLEQRQGVNMRVNLKEVGDCFGEIALIYNSPRNATVAATTDGALWALDRRVFKYYARENQESEVSKIEIFLNSVPILASLSREEKLQLVDALEYETFNQNTTIIKQGDKGDKFYIIVEGEAVVYQSTAQGTARVNMLFKADFFGEAALLSDEPRKATVEAKTRVVALVLKRETFTEILGPLKELMEREKSDKAVNVRMGKLAKAVNIQAEVHIISQRNPSGTSGTGGTGGGNVTANNNENRENIIKAQGHLDEVLELRKGGTKHGCKLLHLILFES